jgi:phosphoribosylanthranilate isomerase
MFKIKICGITTVEDALQAAEAGADAIGLNFYGKSRRNITTSVGVWIAKALAQEFKGKVQIVGVFVNAPIELWLKIAHEVGLDAIQFHGDEPPEALVRKQWPEDALRALQTPNGKTPEPPAWVSVKKDRQIIRAFRCPSSSLEPVGKYLQECKKLRALPDAVLVDAHEPGSYGGTGLAVDWNAVKKEREQLLGLPFILAGGLTPENVAQAIATSRPDAVDVASGVEFLPGRKEAAKVRAFVANAQEAFRKLDKRK